MFLLRIMKKSRKQTYNNLIKYLKLNVYVKTIKNKVSFLNQVNEKKKIKNLSLICNNIYSIKQKNLIKYVVSIKILEKNIFINVTDIKGKLRFFRTSGFVKLKGKRKIKQPLALNSLINSLKSDAKFLYGKPVALHLTDVNSFSYNYTVSKLEEKFLITYIRVFDSISHNGCRPRKIKRGKKRSRRLK